MERDKAAKLAAAALLAWAGNSYGDYLDAQESIGEEVVITPEEWDAGAEQAENVLEAVTEYIQAFVE